MFDRYSQDKKSLEATCLALKIEKFIVYHMKTV